MFNTIALQADASCNTHAKFFPATEAEGIQIIFPEGTNPRSRKVVTRSRARKTGKIPSWKMKRMIQWESKNERLVFRILDADANVSAFFEQPFEVRYEDDSITRAHFPDVLIEFLDGIEVWEIKDSLDANCPDIKKRTELLIPRFAQLGIRYRLVFVDKKNQKGTEAYSLSVRRFGRLPISPVDRECARRIFRNQNTVSWQQIKTGSLGKRGPNIVARLLLEGELATTNQTHALSSKTRIFASTNKQPLVAEWRS